MLLLFFVKLTHIPSTRIIIVIFFSFYFLPFYFLSITLLFLMVENTLLHQWVQIFKLHKMHCRRTLYDSREKSMNKTV